MQSTFTIKSLLITPVVTLALALALIVPTLVSAAPSDSARIGSVDLKRAVWESKAGVRVKKTLKAEAEKAQSDIDSKQSKLESMSKSYSKQRDSLNPAARQEREDEITTLRTELKRIYLDSQKGLQRKEQREEVELLRKLQPVVAKIGKEEAFSMILDKGSFPVVLYADNATDITDKVITRFNSVEK